MEGISQHHPFQQPLSQELAKVGKTASPHRSRSLKETGLSNEALNTYILHYSCLSESLFGYERQDVLR